MDFSERNSELLVNDFIVSDFARFQDYVKSGEELVKQALRYIPPEAYSKLRELLLRFVLESDKEAPPKMKVVVDSNVIVSEAFRVGKGKPSTTLRIFDSPLVELYAPRIIKDEVLEQVRKDLPSGCSLDLAVSWATKLLGKIRLLDDIGLGAIRKAKQKLDPVRFGKDYLFLGVSFEIGAGAIISNDTKAFSAGDLPELWHIGRLADLVLVREGGYVSLFVASGSLKIALGVSQNLLLAISDILTEVGKIVAIMASAILKGSVDILNKIPTWAWTVIIAVGAIVLVYILIDKKRREAVSDALSKFIEFLKDLVSNAIKAFKSLVNAFWRSVISFFTLLIPVINILLIGAGVSMKLIRELLREIEEDRNTRNTVSGIHVF